MKNKKQKTPKSHIPKYSAGGKTRTLANGNEVSDAQSSNAEGTQNIYNDKRSSKLGIGDYANYATAAVNLGTGLYNNQSLSGAAKDQANANTINSTVDSVAGSVTPWYGYAKTASGIGKSMTNPTSVTDPTTGKTVTQSSNRTNQAFSDTFTPMHETTINKASEGDWGGAALNTITGGVYNTLDNYINGTNQKEFDKAKANEATYNQQQTDLANQQNAAAQQQQNSYINNMVNQGISNYASQNKGSYIQYPNGGMNMAPNSEVEKQENTLNPDGSTTQFSGPSHENGGIQTNLDPGTLIFSDKLKMGGKTFAKLNKPNMTHKEDKILEDSKASSMSKLTANLMKQAKNKSSMELFEAQESLKQSKIDSYIKRMGGTQKYPLGGTIPEDKYRQAQTDSLILYKSGINPNIPNFQQNNNYTDAYLRLNQINQQPPLPLNNVDPYSRTTVATYKKPTMIPQNNQLPVNQSIQPQFKQAPVYHPNYGQPIDGIPKSTFRKGGKYKPPVAEYNQQDDIIVPGVKQTTYDYSNVLAPSPYDNQMDITDANTLNNSAYAADYLNNPNAPKPTYDTPQTNEGFDWKGLGTQALSFAANNAGSIYDLARSNKPEVTKFQRATASLLDPTAALRDATEQTRRAEYNVRNASSGNAGTYLSNRVALNAQNIENKDRIRQQYANANAGISNQVNQVNTGIANQEYIANEQNRAVSRNTKQSAISSIGSNSANQMNDIRNTEMDQKKLDGLIKMYPALSKDPEMLNYFMSFHK